MLGSKRILLIAILGVFTVMQSTAQWATNGKQIPNYPDGVVNHPLLAASLHGSSYAVWEELDSLGHYSVKVIGLSDSGRILNGWPAAGITVDSGAAAYEPQLVASEDSGVIVTWDNRIDTTSGAQIFIQKYSRQGVALWNNGLPLKVSAFDSTTNRFPVIVSDGKNGAYITWQRADLNFYYPSTKVVMQHITDLGRRDVLWSGNDVNVGTIPNMPQVYPQLAMTPDGAYLYVAYSRGYIGSDSLILNKFSADNGSVASNWPIYGVVLSTGPQLNCYSQNGDLKVETDKQDNAIVFWLESRGFNLNYDLFEQVVSPAGEIQLQDNGNLLAGANYFTNYNGGFSNGLIYMETTQDTSDGSFLVAFSVVDSITGYDIGLIKTDAQGNLVWDDSLLTLGGYGAYPNAVADGNGGAFIFYLNIGQSPNRLQVIALNPDGTIDTTWVNEGPVFGNNETYDPYNAHYYFSPAYTRKGEAVVVWTALTQTIIQGDTLESLDLYACNALRNGQICTFDTAYPDTLISAINLVSGEREMFKVYPNPATSQAQAYFASSSAYNNLVLKIFDLSGNLVQQNAIVPYAENSVALSGFEQGMYLYQLVGDNEVLHTGKLVRQ